MIARSKSVEFTVYDKSQQLQNTANDISEEERNHLLDHSKNIARVEVRCLPAKVAELKKKYGTGIIDLLHEDIANELIHYYYFRLIGYDDFCNQYYAKKRILTAAFTKKKEEKLIEFQLFIKSKRSMKSAKDSFYGTDKTFRSYVKELHDLHINPVVSPQNWKDKYKLDEIPAVSKNPLEPHECVNKIG